MKNYKSAIILLILIWICFIGCGKTTPEEYFNRAVLNINMFSGFAGNGMLRQLESPSVKLSDDGGTVPMPRSEIINTKINFIEENYEKVKNLKVTEETKDMITASLALYEFVLPVYKTDYIQLAELYDKNAPKEQTESFANSIHDKYSAKFGELFDKLVSYGKDYAKKNSINVKWDVQTSPSPH